MLAAFFNEIIQYSLPILLFQWIILNFFYIVKCQCIGFKFWVPFLDKDKAFPQTENSSSCSWTCNPTKSFDINSLKVSLHICSSQIDSFRQSGYPFIPCSPQFYKAALKRNHKSAQTAATVWCPSNLIAFIIWQVSSTFPSSHIHLGNPSKTLNSHLCKWSSSFTL